MSSNNNDDPFAKLLSQHKEEQNKNQLEPNSVTILIFIQRFLLNGFLE
jgi:hypothetical protein